MSTPTPVVANWSKDMVDQTNKRWAEFWNWCEQAGVPVPLREALLRDALAGIEAMRLAPNLQHFIPALRK